MPYKCIHKLNWNKSGTDSNTESFILNRIYETLPERILEINDLENAKYFIPVKSKLPDEDIVAKAEKKEEPGYQNKMMTTAFETKKITKPKRKRNK